MFLKLTALFATLAGFSLIACNSTTAPTVSTSASLEAYTWQLSALTASPAVTKNGVKITDVFDSLFSGCNRKQTETFKSSNAVTQGTDSAGCTSDTGSGTWSLNSSDLTTIFPQGSNSMPDTTIYTLVSVSTTKLVVSWAVPATGSNSAGDGVAHTATETFTATAL